MPKQLRPVAGKPLVVRALDAFLAHPAVAHVVLVLPADTAAAPPPWLLLTDPRVTLVAGGAERADSVRLGLARLPDGCDVVLVHDAARPFVPRAVIDRVIDAVREGHGAVPALPVSDTLKRGSGHPPSIESTVPRDGLWQVQTPQGFPRAALEAAHQQAARRSPAATGTPATDDATLVEESGLTVRLVHGSSFNIKVTTPEDFVLAELISAGPPP